MGEVHIRFLPDGRMEVEGKGFTGPECEKALADLLALLNPESKTEQKKPEYYQSQKQKVKQG